MRGRIGVVSGHSDGLMTPFSECVGPVLRGRLNFFADIALSSDNVRFQEQSGTSLGCLGGRTLRRVVCFLRQIGPVRGRFENRQLDLSATFVSLKRLQERR